MKKLREFIPIFFEYEFRILLLLVIIILLIGTMFYHEVEGWTFIDSLYFSVVTLTTVGYGDLSPKTEIARLFTIVYIFSGIGIILGFVDGVARHARKRNPLRKIFKK